MTKIAAIVLAAGSSRRYGNENKLAADLHGKPVLSHVLDRVAKLPLAQRLIITAPNAAEVAPLCDPNLFEVIENSKATNGMGSSISAGVSRLEKMDGAMVILGDMPFIAEKTFLKLIDAFRSEPKKTIIAPSCEGRRGHPVIFRRSHFDQLKSLSDDTGAKEIIEANKAALLTVAVNDRGVVSDIDAPSDLAEQNRRHPQAR